MRRNLLKQFMLTLSFFLLGGAEAWADIDFGNEEVVSEATTWTFSGYEVAAGKTETQNLSVNNKLYNRSASSGRGFYFDDLGETMNLHFSDVLQTQVSVNRIAKSKAFNNSHMNAKTAGTNDDETTPFFAFNTNVSGTCYALVKSDGSKQIRIFWGKADGTTALQSVNTTANTVTEIKLQADAGVFFIGGASTLGDGDNAREIYAIRFVPDMVVDAENTWTFGNFNPMTFSTGSIYNLQNGLYARAKGRSLAIAEQTDCSSWTFGDGHLESTLSNCITLGNLSNGTAGTYEPSENSTYKDGSIALKITVPGKIYVVASGSDATKQIRIQQYNVTPQLEYSQSITTTPTEYSTKVEIGTVYIAATVANAKVYAIRFVPETVTTPTIRNNNGMITITPGVSSIDAAVKTYYTTDGSEPTASSDEYTAPFTQATAATIKAITISQSSGATASDISEPKAVHDIPTELTSNNISFANILEEQVVKDDDENFTVSDVDLGKQYQVNSAGASSIYTKGVIFNYTSKSGAKITLNSNFLNLGSAGVAITIPAMTVNQYVIVKYSTVSNDHVPSLSCSNGTVISNPSSTSATSSESATVSFVAQSNGGDMIINVAGYGIRLFRIIVANTLATSVADGQTGWGSTSITTVPLVAETGYFTKGSSVTVTATPNEGYYFVNWKNGDTPVSTDAAYTFNISENLTLEANFAAKTDLSTAVITLDHDSFVYDGTEKSPSVTGVTLSESPLTQTTDYTVNAITAQTNVGDSYEVTITGAGHYTGTATKTWSITPVTISSVAITGITAPKKDVALDVAAACATTGITSTTPAVTWKVGDTEKTGQAEANKDYTAYVTLTADANYQFVEDPLATGTINGEAAIVSRTDANNIIVSYTFPTTGKIAINPSVSLTGWTYGSAANTPTVEGNTGNGEVTYQYKLASAAEEAYSTFDNEHYPTAVGEYNIKANIAANGDYAAGSAVNTFTIAQAAGTVSFTTATPEKTWSATAAENAYTQVATVTGDAVPSYALSNNTCGATIEGAVVTFTQAGSVTVTATVVDTENYTYATKTASYTLTVTKAALSTLSVNITGWAWGEYNSTTNAPQVTGNTGNGTVTIEYKVQTADDNTYVTQIPIDAGNYTVRVSVAETDNYQAGSATANFTIAAATSYSVTLPAASNGNSITATKTSNAHVGDEITLTITTASTYLLKSIYGDHGIELSEVLNQPTKRKFTMPAADVTITATWEEKTAENAKTQITEEVKIEGDNAEITKVDVESTTTTVTISSSVGGKTVTSIDADAFSGLTNEQKANLQCVDLSSTGIVLTMVRDAANSPIRDLDANTLVYLPEGSTMDGQNVIIKDGANYNCSQFVMTDTKSYGIPHAFTATNAFLIRDFTNGQTCTVCLPFSVPAADIPGKIYRYTSISGNQVTMTEDTDGLDANVPYILVPNGNDNIHRSGGGITVQITGATTVNDNFTFKGIYEDHTFTAEEISKGVYGFAGNNAVGATPGHFAKAATGAYIKGMRAYLEYTGSSTDPGLDGPDVPATARGLSDEDLPETLNIVLVNADGSTTSIGKLELIEIDDDTPRYNLNGQRVGKDYKGIVIINGKKVFIK